MADDEVLPIGRRDYDIRLQRLEGMVQTLDKIAGITEVRLQGLVTTLDSRFKAFDHGQLLILEKLDRTPSAESVSTVARSNADALTQLTKRVDESSRRIDILDEVRTRAEGAIQFGKWLGWGGVIGGVIAIVKIIAGSGWKP